MKKNNEKEEKQEHPEKDEKINNQEKQEEKEEPEETKEEQLEKQVEEYKEKMQRIRADFDNFQKRSEKEKEEFVKYANEGLILKVLEAYEDLGRALEVKKTEDLKEGVELIYKKLTKILKDEGLEEIKTVNEKFDPYKHEALLVEKTDKYDNNTVIEELAKGYSLKSKVIKYAKVKVSKNNTQKNNQKKNKVINYGKTRKSNRN
ncbi:MAG: nucleotide exchange factor GrpE [Methanobacteriaceae archaeon]|nr:nucleotide exchange factor GrpE [Methanobacteriaceae archaeon]